MKLKEYAKTTMNELLGMYGYEKFHTRDTQGLNIRNQFESSNDPSLSAAASSSTSSSVTHANRISNASKYKDIIITADDSHSASSPTSGSVGGSVDGRASVCRTPSPFTAETYTENNGNESKDVAEDNEGKPPGCIVCSWCQKVGMKLFTLRTGNGCKAFCSELCFTQCRRASFKKNKICDWCKHVRHTVNYVDFQDGEQQLQFCSNKCLNQYKMHIFCNETQAHLQLHPHLNDSSASKVASNKVPNLITPELWLKDFKNGENESSSINSYRDSSDADSEADNEDSPPIVPHSIKRKLSEFSTEQNETNLSKGSKVKNNQKHKNNKETKRHKQSSSSGALSQNSNRLPINKNLHIKNEWFAREARDNTLPSFQSPPHLPIGRFSPPTNPAMRGATIVTPNQQHIPLINGTPVNLRTSAPPIHGMPSIALSGQMFPRVPGSMVRPELLRPPLIHSNMFAGTPMPNFSPAHMEMLLRMQNGLSGLRHPFPYPPHAPTSGHPFTAMASMPVGAHHSGGQPLAHPSPQTSVSTPLTANASLLPPVTIMMPYPVPIPLPIPIPIPILFPINKNNWSETNATTDNICNNGNNCANSCNNFLNVTNNSKIESVITKLVEKNKIKTANNNNVVGYHRSNHHNHNDNDSSNGDNSLDLTRKDNTNVVFKNNETNNELQNQKSDNSTETSFPQNLIVSRNKRCVGTTITSNLDNGYRVQ